MRLYYDNAGTWVRVSAIVDFPNISSKANMYGFCIVKLRDFEGALFDTWINRDFTKMLVTDDADADVANCNIIFRGYLKNKKYHAKDLILEIVGIGEILERKSFGSEEGYNEAGYVLAEGKVDTCNASSIIDLYDDKDDDEIVDGNEAFEWTPDIWISGDKDVALLIVDNTADYADIEWQSTGIVPTNEEAEGGDNDSILDFDDDPQDYYWARDTSIIPTLVVTPTIDGADIDGTGVDRKYLKEIKIEYSFRGRIKSSSSQWSFTTIIFQIKNGPGADDWEDIKTLYMDAYNETDTYSWINGLIEGTEGATIGPYIISGTDEELQKYLKKPANDYTELEGMRLKFYSGGLPGDTAYAEIHVDYIKVIISHSLYDVKRVMRPITGNTATTVTCSSVDDFQQLGITNKSDVFQIGQNTRAIINDISASAGIGIEIVGNMFDTGTENIVPDTDIDVNWAFSTEANHWDSVNQVDASIIRADSTDDGQIEEFGMTSFTLSDKHADAYISELTLYVSAKDNGDSKLLAAKMYYDGEWDSINTISETLTNNYVLYSATASDLNLKQADLDAIKSSITADILAIGENIHVRGIYITATWTVDQSFNKYMARKFKGKHCIDVLESVRKLEGADWIEDYIHNRIILIKPPDYMDSGISLTQANYEHEWEYEDKCNQVSRVYVWGKTSYNPISKVTTNIFWKEADPDIVGGASKQITDDSISNLPDAEEVAKTQLALLKVKRPSIRIPLDGINADLQLGTYVNLTMARPTVAAADYKIRMIERFKRGKIGIKTIIYAGMGETKWDDMFKKILKSLQSEIHRLSSERLTAGPYEPGSGGTTWGSITGAQIAVEAIITAELVNGQSIDNAIDTLIAATYTNVEIDNLLAALDYYTQAQVNGLLHPQAHTLASHSTKAHAELTDYNAEANVKHLTDAQVAALHATYTNAEAVQAVEDAGLVLSATKVITSQDADLNFLFGRVGLGYDGAQADQAIFAHRDCVNATDFALKQDNLGNTLLNAKATKGIYFDINDATIMDMTVDGLRIGADARITEFDTAPLANSDTKVPTNTTVKEYIDAKATINIDGTPADATYTGIVLDIDTTDCATYDAVYVDGLNSVAKADATDITKMPAIGVVVAAGKVLVLGVVRNDAAWVIAAANKVYVDDTTPGELVNTVAGLNENGNIIQIMGVAVGNDMLYINPSLDWVVFVE